MCDESDATKRNSKNLTKEGGGDEKLPSTLAELERMEFLNSVSFFKDARH